MVVWTARINSYQADDSCEPPSSSLLFFSSLLQQLAVSMRSDWRRRQQNNMRRHTRRWGGATWISHSASAPSRQRGSSLNGGGCHSSARGHLEATLRRWHETVVCQSRSSGLSVILRQYRLTHDTCSRWDSAARGGALKDNYLFCVSWTLQKRKETIRDQSVWHSVTVFLFIFQIKGRSGAQGFVSCQIQASSDLTLDLCQKSSVGLKKYRTWTAFGKHVFGVKMKFFNNIFP